MTGTVKTLMSLAAAAVVVGFFAWAAPKAPDAIEDLAPSPRLHITTDPATGCQYLSQEGGGIYPRMNEEGQQICGQKGTHEQDDPR